ncbi:MAG TPA: hypothetical protein VJ935_05805 [Acidimicrobiia bacterium]|nr:hypothetical protein [Acidimicrobiia bacterium]
MVVDAALVDGTEVVGGVATGAGELVVGTAGEPGVGSTGDGVHATSIAAATTADSRFIVEATLPARAG